MLVKLCQQKKIWDPSVMGSMNTISLLECNNERTKTKKKAHGKRSWFLLSSASFPTNPSISTLPILFFRFLHCFLNLFLLLPFPFLFNALFYSYILIRECLRVLWKQRTAQHRLLYSIENEIILDSFRV